MQGTIRIEMIFTFTRLIVIGALAKLAISSNEYEEDKSIFSPEGRCVPLDYASRAVEKSSVCLGIQCKNGIILASVPKITEKPVTRWAYERDYIHRVDNNIGVALAGINSDCNFILTFLRRKANEYRSQFGAQCSAKKLADSLSSFLFDLSRESDSRPLAVSIILAANDDETGSELYYLDNTGSFLPCLGCFSDPKLSKKWKMKLVSKHFNTLDFDEAIDNLKEILAEIFLAEREDLYGHAQVSYLTSHLIQRKSNIVLFPTGN